MTEQQNQRDYLTLREIADELAVSKEQVRQWCISGELRSANYGIGTTRHRRVKREWFDAFKRGRESLREQPVSRMPRPVASVWKWQGKPGVVASEQGSSRRAVARG
jgi:excisionase family DNA binding protein